MGAEKADSCENFAGRGTGAGKWSMIGRGRMNDAQSVASGWTNPPKHRYPWCSWAHSLTLCSWYVLPWGGGKGGNVPSWQWHEGSYFPTMVLRQKEEDRREIQIIWRQGSNKFKTVYEEILIQNCSPWKTLFVLPTVCLSLKAWQIHFLLESLNWQGIIQWFI